MMDSSNSQVSSAANPESLHLDSLPEVVESVSQAQKQQTSEIEQHQAVLSNLQVGPHSFTTNSLSHSSHFSSFAFDISHLIV